MNFKMILTGLSYLCTFSKYNVFIAFKIKKRKVLLKGGDAGTESCKSLGKYIKTFREVKVQAIFNVNILFNG